MTAIVERQYSSAADWCSRIAGFSVVLLLTAALGHRFSFVETIPFLWVLGIAGVLAVLALCLGAVALVQLWKRGAYGGWQALRGIVLAGCVLVPFGVSAMRMVQYPMLVDISTDVENPPPLDRPEKEAGGEQAQSFSPQNNALQQRHYPKVAGRRYAQAQDVVLAAIRTMIAERDWQMIDAVQSVQRVQDPSVTLLHAVAGSFLLGFPSDIAIRIRDDESATYVDMRSASRYGRHDLGDNAARINRFLSELDEKMAALAGV